MMLAILLTGCRKTESHMQSAMDFRTALQRANGCTFSADVTAEYPEKVFTFSLDCVFENDQMKLRVTKPGVIEGICAGVHNGTASLEFEDISLEFGKLANGNVAPLTAPWILASAWKSDYISSAGADGNRTRATILKGYNDEELTIDTWFENELPVYAEISYAGTRVLQISIENFTYL